MGLKLRILTNDGGSVSATSPTEELLAVLRDSFYRQIMLDRDDEETLRGWLLVRADELENGAIVTIGDDKTVCIGKSAEGRAFVRDGRTDWPPLKPIFGESKF
jgi:hypothetical protein